MAYSDKIFEEVAINFVEIEAVSTKCRVTFSSRSKLYNYLKSGCLEMTLLFVPTQAALSIPIMASKTIHQFFSSGLIFKCWTYITTTITFTPKHPSPNFDPDSAICLNIRCEVTLVDKAWLSKYLAIQKINTMSTFLKVRGIKAFKNKSGEFAALSLYFPGKNNTKQLVYISLTCVIHLVKGLRANLLIGNNIISSEGFVIDVKWRSILISTCGVTIPINTRQKEQFLIRRLLSS